MMRSAIVFLLLLPGLLPLSSSHLKAQEVGTFLTVARSNQLELPSPSGFGASALMELVPGWLVRLSFHRTADDTSKEGIVCRNYSARIGCLPEMTETSVTLNGFRGALLRTFESVGGARLGVGAGGSFNQINAAATGVSGRVADLLAPNSGQLGFLVLLSGAVTPVPRIPVRVSGTVTGHWVNFRSCSDNDPPQYSPFCGTDRFEEIELGLSYAF